MGTFRIKLRTCPNPDFGETSAPLPPKVVQGTLDEVLAAGRAYGRSGIGGGNWAGGQIQRNDGGVWGTWVDFAKMSYNGRVWAPNGQVLFESETASFKNAEA